MSNFCFHSVSVLRKRRLSPTVLPRITFLAPRMHNKMNSATLLCYSLSNVLLECLLRFWTRFRNHVLNFRKKPIDSSQSPYSTRERRILTLLSCWSSSLIGNRMVFTRIATSDRLQAHWPSDAFRSTRQKMSAYSMVYQHLSRSVAYTGNNFLFKRTPTSGTGNRFGNVSHRFRPRYFPRQERFSDASERRANDKERVLGSKKSCTDESQRILCDIEVRHIKFSLLPRFFFDEFCSQKCCREPRKYETFG